jgi:hypothetical protein
VQTSFFVVIAGNWLDEDRNRRLLGDQRCPVGRRLPHLEDRCRLFVKFRDSVTGRLRGGAQDTLQSREDDSYIASQSLGRELRANPLRDDYGLFYFDGSATTARCVFLRAPASLLERLEEAYPETRASVHDIPPVTSVVVTSPDLVRALSRLCGETDDELFAPYASQFINGPHILEQLLTHLMELRVDEAPNFVTVTKGLADQVRVLLDDDASPVRIEKVTHSHVEAWARFQDEEVTFVDGGAARLTSLPGIEPAAIRVGVYTVVPGVTDPARRETFEMDTRLIADMTIANAQTGETDRKRLQEASRYVLELLVALREADRRPGAAGVFLHGPLVNQFVAYDNQEPNYLPSLAPSFLERFAIGREQVCETVDHLPNDTTGTPLWREFMAIYAHLLQRVAETPVPMVGVVERSTGHPVTEALLNKLVNRRVVTDAYHRAAEGLISKYRITDEFLFGCLLDQGEYMTPVEISKNPPRRAHAQWAPVVEDFPSPSATLIKTSAAMPPFRVELNPAGKDRLHDTMILIYHTARLLPSYAFPVGLDIVDKYAKVPDWIARGVSVAMAASVMRRVIRDGDATAIAQARQFLAGEPRDFFYRPNTRLTNT